MMNASELGWNLMKELSEEPNVAAAIENFLCDTTEDNAICMVREVVFQHSQLIQCKDEGCPHHGTTHVCVPRPKG